MTEFFPGTGRALRGFFIVLVFGLFPVLTGAYGLRQIALLEEERAAAKLTVEQGRLLTRVQTLDDEPALRTRVIGRVFDRLKRMVPDRAAALEPPAAACALIERVHRFFPDQLELYVFGEDGIIPELSRGPRGKGALVRGFRALTDAVERKKMTAAGHGLLCALFQVSSAETLPSARGRYQPLIPRPRDSGVIWDRHLKRKSGIRGFIAVFHDGTADSDRPLRLLLRRVNRLRKDIALGWCRQDAADQIYITPNVITRDPGIMRETLAAFSRFDRQIQTEESFASLAPRRENGHLIAVSKRPRLISDEAGIFLRLVGAGWVLLIFLRRDRIGTGFGARLPLKLGALFLTAAGVPSLLLVISGSYALRDHAHVRRQMIEDFVVSRVRNFDERSEERVTAFEVTLARLVEKAQRQETDAGRAAVFEPLRNTEVTDQMLVIDEKGRCLVEHFIQGSAVPEVQKKLVSAVGTEVVRKLRGSSEVDAATLSADAVTDFAGGIMGKGVLNAEVLIQGMKRFQTIRFGSGNGMFYENTLLGRDGRPEWLVHIGIDRNAFQNKYCLREYRSLRRAGDLPIRLSAIHRVHPFRTIIDEGMDGTVTREIARLAELRRVIAREVRTERGEEVLWIGFPCRMLDSYTLVAKAPLGSVAIAINGLWRQLWLLAGMLLCSGALMAWLLTEQVLLPLRDVATGIEAIARRDFRHRVPIRADDELGEIAGLLNRVTEGMHDLEVARVVQESLFPGEGLNVREYGIYGVSRAMTDIGGDYFDYRVVGGRHLIGLIGDVAGHGVPAALIMGMAKSAFSLLTGPDRPLEQFLIAFNELLVAQGTRRKHMMTVFCFILDLETGILTVLNGGHNFPLLYRAATGRAEEIELIGHPLGVRRKVLAERGEFALQPGDALVLYTDGVIESRNGADAVVGYERAAAWVAEAAGRPDRTAREVVEELFRRFDAFIGNQPAGDDITLVCLKRRPLVSGGGNV